MDEDLAILATDIIDYCNDVEAAASKLRVQIEKLIGESKDKNPKRHWSWMPEEISWTEAEGPKGKYQRSEDVNNLDHKALLKDLTEHKGFLFREGWSYWTFKNGWTIGRKRKEKAEI